MRQLEGRIDRITRLQEGIYSCWVACPGELCREARPGQFVNFYLSGGGHLLPRPISICEKEEGSLRFVFRVSGEGTRLLSLLQEGDPVTISTPLGNGFPVEGQAGKRVLLVGGGIGVPPLLETAKALKKNGAEPVMVMGYRSEPFLQEEFSSLGALSMASEDGSAGVKGTVVDAMRAGDLTGDVLFACGPKPMLRAVASYAKEKGMECFVSMEERMACGVGACLACVCETAKEDPHFHTKTARVCKDGPVFSSEEVVL